MINTPNKTVEVYNVVLAGVADLPLFVHVCVYGGKQRGEEGAGRRIFGSQTIRQLDKSVLCVLLLANTMEMN